MQEMREKLAAAGGDESIKRARRGGVVDVEFIAQMYALKHDLRSGGTVRRLRTLRDEGILAPQRIADLMAAYRFLLALESRIRIVEDLPEDRLPEDPRPLALRIGYVDTSAMTAEAALREEYEYHRQVAARGFREAVEELTGG
jgi:glutamate-ammonia-ligase adenylyltransferase